MQTSQSPLDKLDVARHCHVDWDKMEVRDAAGTIRHCQTCRKNVYNVSVMSRAEALALIQEHEGNLCVRFARRADGTIICGDCPIEQMPLSKPVIWAFVLTIVFAIAPTSARLALINSLASVLPGKRIAHTYYMGGGALKN